MKNFIKFINRSSEPEIFNRYRLNIFSTREIQIKQFEPQVFTNLRPLSGMVILKAKEMNANI